MENTIQLEFSTPINQNGISLLAKLDKKQISSTSFEVKLHNDEIPMLVKNLTNLDCVPVRVNTMTLLQQKYLEITA